MFKYLCLILISIQLICNVRTNDDSNDLVFVKDVEDEKTTNEEFKISEELFIPTSEWQTLKKDQGIPSGLHVRLNVQTGVREAKLMEGTAWIDGKVVKIEDLTKITRSQEKIREALLQINDDKIDVDSDQKIDEIKNKFRSYQELKEEIDHMNISMNTDSELIQSLINQFNKSNDKDIKLRVLIDLEYFVHKFDNGLLFCDMGGFEIIMKELNSTQDKELQMQAALVLGASMQSNPKVKVHAIKLDILQLLLSHISHSLNDLDLDSQDYVSKLIFVLSSLLRNFPFAQSQFIRFGGVEIAKKVLNTQFNTNKIKVKVITLANDLIVEKIDSNKNSNNDSLLKQEQYSQVNLIEKLVESDWCANLNSLLINTKNTEHDSVEKLLDSILNLIDVCQVKFKLSLRESLQNFQKHYESLARSEDDDDYFSLVLNKIKLILENLEKNVQAKVEL